MTKRHQIKTDAPVTEKDIRSILDTLGFDDNCGGWRSIAEMANALAEEGANLFPYEQKVRYWFAKHNEDDRFFETRFVDGEWCYRSHKYHLCRTPFLKTLADYRNKLIRYPDKKQELTVGLSLQLRAALQPPRSSLKARKHLAYA
jgi:hypothetical protein